LKRTAATNVGSQKIVNYWAVVRST